jgi:hypothetical protein
MGSYQKVLDGFTIMDKNIPLYDNIKFEQNNHQYGKTLSDTGYDTIIHETLNCNQIGKDKERVYEMDSIEWTEWFSEQIQRFPEKSQEIADLLVKATKVRLTS